MIEDHWLSRMLDDLEAFAQQAGLQGIRKHLGDVRRLALSEIAASKLERVNRCGTLDDGPVLRSSDKTLRPDA